ncbi:HNH endonuclease [Candidatus Dojkabacteria bacterium]|nr:HNH endonuclease [Candidatus Dojkabacteria bacterium]
MNTKMCPKCNQQLPITPEYFRVRTNGKPQSYCIQCEEVYKKEWYEKTRPAQLEKRKQNYRDNREKRLAQCKERQLRLKKELSAYIKEYYQNNKERIEETNKRWRDANADKVRMYQRTYQRTRKGIKLGIDKGKPYTPEEWDLVTSFFGDKCVYCGKKTKLTMDHFIPVTSGGSTTLDNIVPACQKCNSSKSNHEPEKWCSPETYNYLSSLLVEAR